MSGGTSASELFQRHHLAVYRYLLRMTREPALAEDLTQETFLRVVRGLDSYREQDRQAAWLFRIARNLLLDHRKQQARRPRPIDLDTTPEPPSRPRQHIAVSLDAALAALAIPECEAFVLREVGGLSYQEIGAVTEATIDAVRSRIYRARCALRRTLAEGRRGVARLEARS